jgi:F0F1-type ATP synthase membrane subunit b/b'
MEESDKEDTLHHLLDMESQASSLVKDAQAEADRRVTASEAKGRAGHDDAYAEEAAKFDAEYRQSVEAVNDEFLKELDAFRAALTGKSTDQAAFNMLAVSFLLGGR